MYVLLCGEGRGWLGFRVLVPCCEHPWVVCRLGGGDGVSLSVLLGGNAELLGLLTLGCEGSGLAKGMWGILMQFWHLLPILQSSQHPCSLQNTA